MRMKSLPSIVGLVLGAIAVAMPANADGKWTGPGYYISEDFSEVGMMYEIVAGPYSSEAECKAALEALSKEEKEQGGAECSYEATDPDAGNN
ncbi:MAG: hypothetical protein KGJ78_17680 [Alphaproteobacteria bacterium]|nr:hypothetical protein [Alphaproteobacteria bacterium]